MLYIYTKSAERIDMIHMIRVTYGIHHFNFRLGCELQLEFFLSHSSLLKIMIHSICCTIVCICVYIRIRAIITFIETTWAASFECAHKHSIVYRYTQYVSICRGCETV